jgi:hypothetical protein
MCLGHTRFTLSQVAELPFGEIGRVLGSAVSTQQATAFGTPS